MSLLGGSGSRSFQSCQSELLLALGLIRAEPLSILIHVAGAGGGGLSLFISPKNHSEYP